MKEVKKNEELFKVTRALPSQDRLAIIRSVALARPSFILRVHPTELTVAAAQLFEKMLCHEISDILEIPDNLCYSPSNTPNIILRHALALPMRSGGLGLTDLTIVNSIAYVASASGTSQKEITNMVFTMIKKWLDNSEYHPQQLSQPLRAALRPPTYEHSHTLLRLSNKNHAAFLRFTYSTFHRQVPTGTHAKACDAPNCAQANNIFDTDGSGYRAFNHWVSCVHRRFPNVSHLHASTLRLIAMLIHERSDGTVQCVVEPEEYDVTLCTVCKYWFLAGSAKFHDCAKFRPNSVGGINGPPTVNELMDDNTVEGYQRKHRADLRVKVINGPNLTFDITYINPSSSSYAARELDQIVNERIALKNRKYQEPARELGEVFYPLVILTTGVIPRQCNDAVTALLRGLNINRSEFLQAINFNLIQAVGDIVCSAERELFRVSHARPSAAAAGLMVGPSQHQHQKFTPPSVAERQLYDINKRQETDATNKEEKKNDHIRRLGIQNALEDANLYKESVPITGASSTKKQPVIVDQTQVAALGITATAATIRGIDEVLSSFCCSIQLLKYRLDGHFNTVDMNAPRRFYVLVNSDLDVSFSKPKSLLDFLLRPLVCSLHQTHQQRGLLPFQLQGSRCQARRKNRPTRRRRIR